MIIVLVACSIFVFFVPFDSLKQNQDQGIQKKKTPTIETLNSSKGHRTNSEYNEDYQNPKTQFQEQNKIKDTNNNPNSFNVVLVVLAVCCCIFFVTECVLSSKFLMRA